MNRGEGQRHGHARHRHTVRRCEPEVYEKLLVSLIFAPYVIDIVALLAQRTPTRVLEIAAGTGVLTRPLASVVPDEVCIVATDLNQAMLDHAASVGKARAVEWRQADAMQLPFADGSFDAVVCQFGVVFFPDDPPRFLARVPHGHHDLAKIADDLKQGGLAKAPATRTVAARSRAASTRVRAMAYCLGMPLRREIEARNASRLETPCAVATGAMEARFGLGAVDGKIQAARRRRRRMTIGRNR